ncbi:MAG TPA: HAD-IIB family hydrolase [Candidatus Paceibacterota bacterium]|nr:HAD-IIB family hydrolase [Candidatus Paceibacterota bacterium]
MDKEALIFDLDGTLAESKQPIDAETADLLKRLAENRKVAIITGGSFAQIEKEFVSRMPQDTKWDHFFLFPASGTSFYRRDNGAWKEVYAEKLSDEEKKRITSILLEAEARLGLAESKIYGEKVEDRGSQVTYSALGQAAPVEVKRVWDPDKEKRRRIAALVTPFLSGYSVGIGGMTSIDVTKGGIDKGYGVRRVSETIGVPIEKMAFVGDALMPGGNDYPARSTGIECVEVAGPEDTKRFIKGLI